MITEEQVRDWFVAGGPIAALREARQGIGNRREDEDYLDRLLGLPPSLGFAARCLLDEDPATPDGALDSLPFYSLCRGFFLPLMALPPERWGPLFGLPPEPPLENPQKEQRLHDFLHKDLGLPLAEKIGLVMGDPFLGRSASVREDTLTRTLAALAFQPVSLVRSQIVKAGDLASLFAMRTPRHRSDPPVTTREVTVTLAHLRDARPQRRQAVLRDLFARCGRLEAYVVAALILDKVHLALSSRRELILESLARETGVPAGTLSTVAALTDLFEVARILETEGPEGLKKVVLKPLSPILPALAGGHVSAEMKLPIWFECKYDGIRIMLHKAMDEHHRVLSAAYTRKRNDWSELIPGLAALARVLPCREAILDGELHGTVLDLSGLPRPCTVYEVHQFLRGERQAPVNLRYTAFDLLYLDGVDLTTRPFMERRAILERLCMPLLSMPLPVPLGLSQGSRATTRDQVNRLYEQFRSQGHEGGIAKVEASPYALAMRTPDWMKRKPEETLDLTITGAFWSDPATAGRRMFDSYTISCRTPEGFHEIGTVAGLDETTTLEVARSIMSLNLLAGRPVERRGHQRTAAGVEVLPYIVVSVAYERVVRDEEGKLSLRGPRIRAVRTGEKPVSEIDTLADLERLYVHQGLG